MPYGHDEKALSSGINVLLAVSGEVDFALQIQHAVFEDAEAGYERSLVVFELGDALAVAVSGKPPMH